MGYIDALILSWQFVYNESDEGIIFAKTPVYATYNLFINGFRNICRQRCLTLRNAWFVKNV